MILNTLRAALGGAPDEVPEAYRRNSPLVASLPDGGNARLLRSTPVRLYTEPDVDWWITQRNLDLYDMHVLDHAAFTNVLRIAGNPDAELITTSGKGFRPNGLRHPHSWSIVDEAELAEWIGRLLGR
jgi:hypothetical protein